MRSSSEKQFTYGNMPGSNLLQTLTIPCNMTLSQSYETQRDLLTGMAYHRSNTLVTQRSYSYDALGRPLTRITVRNGQTVNDSFVHNSRSELASAMVNGAIYGYDYDNIGNRTAALEESSDVASRTEYTANELNQYTSIQENEETVFAPTFDADGNQTRVKTTTGIWSVEYNAENRPIRFTSEDEATVIECSYDSMGRRATKKVSVNGSVTLYQRFLYRGYLQIACCDLTRSNHPCLWLIIWDPSQPVATRPLAIQKDGTWYTYGWDLTKNICEVFGQHGYIRTNYSYSPYGEVTISGDVTQPIQWSSEYSDSEMNLVYYNYRHYSPLDGRWLRRDTVDKIDNAYKFISNLVSLKNDYLGNYEIASEEITDEKIDIAIAIGWYDAISIKDTDEQAWNCASKSGYTDSWGGNNDAIRHCTWVCKMAQKIGYEQAIEVGNIHETYSPPTPPRGARRVDGYENLEKWAIEDIAMDKHNNQIGATLGASDCNMDCCHACIAKLDEKVLQVNAPGGYRFLR